MRTKRIIALTLVMVLCTSAISMVCAQPLLPHLFHGTLKDATGREVPPGAVIVAVVDNIERGRITTTEAGEYGYPANNRLIVQGSIEKPIEAGSEIIFFVNGTRANETATFKSEEVTQLNLTVSRLEDIVTYGQVPSATGTGIVTFLLDYGIIENLTAMAEATLPTEGKPDVAFPHGLFSFKITKIEPGANVTLTITFPSPVPTTAQYWKYHTPEGWYKIPVGSNDGDNTITIQLTDGGIGDDDGIANGVIVDPGGLGTSRIPPTTPPPATPAPAVRGGGGGGAAAPPAPTPTPTITPVVTPSPAPLLVVTPTPRPVMTPTPTPTPPYPPMMLPPLNVVIVIGIALVVAVLIIAGAYRMLRRRKA